MRKMNCCIDLAAYCLKSRKMTQRIFVRVGYSEDLHLEADEFGGVGGEDRGEDVDPAVVGRLETLRDDAGVCLVGPAELGKAEVEQDENLLSLVFAELSHRRLRLLWRTSC